MFPNDNKDDISPTSSVPEVNADPKPTAITEPWQPPTPIPSGAVTNQPADPNTPLPDPANMFQSQTSTPPPKKTVKKKTILIFLAVFLFLIGAGGYVFGLYIPSKPENVYSKAMDRSGQALDKVMNQITEKSQLDKFKKGQYDGVASIDFAPMKIDATLAVKYDKSRLDFKTEAKVSEDGQGEKTYKAQVLTEIKDGATYPDIYFIFSGIKDLGLDGLVPGIEKLDQTWVKVDEGYINDVVESLQSQLGGGGDTDVSNQPPELSNDDVAELSRIFSGVVKDYILTDDASKGILVNKNFIGKEKVDGLNTYHYVIGINKDNYEKACIDAGNRFLDSTAYKKLTESKEEDIKTAKEDAKKSCEDSKKNIKDDETFDMWVDAKYKLIYKIRDYDDQNTEDYIEVGQKYTGGDDLRFFVNYEGKKDKIFGKFTLDINKKSLVSKSKLTIDTQNDSVKGKFELGFDGKPLEGDIAIEKPSNPKSIQDVIKV